MPYKVTTRIKDEPTDWESLRAAVGVLRVVVPVVCDVWVGQATAEQAVETVLDEWEIPNECRDNLSITDQAYKLSTMLSHLRRDARKNKGFWKKHKDLAGFAIWMKDVHGAQIKVKTKCPAKKVAPSGSYRDS